MPSKPVDKSKKVFDVAKPGKTAAGASGRPLIIGHKNMIKDPMVKETDVDGLDSEKPATAPVIDKPEEDKTSGEPDTSTKPSEASEASPTSTKINIKPLDEPETPNDEANNTEASEITKESPKPDDSDKVEVQTSVKKDEEPAQDEAKKPSENVDNSENSDSEEAALDAVAVQALQKKNKQEESDDKVKQEKLNKLIQEKKYFAPIGVKTRKRNTRSILIVLLVMIMVAIVALYLLIDAEIIDIGVKVPYNIIK